MIPSANSQKMDLKLAPLWGGTSLNFLRKIIDVGGSLGLREHSKNGPKVDPSMRQKINEFL